MAGLCAHGSLKPRGCEVAAVRQSVELFVGELVLQQRCNHHGMHSVEFSMNKIGSGCCIAFRSGTSLSRKQVELVQHSADWKLLYVVNAWHSAVGRAMLVSPLGTP